MKFRLNGSKRLFALAALCAVFSTGAKAAEEPPACEYRVAIGDGESQALTVDVRCDAISTRDMVFHSRGAHAFAGFEPGSDFATTRYTFDIDGFIKAKDNYRIAWQSGQARMLTLASWLAVPRGAPPSTRLRIRVQPHDSRGASNAFLSALPRDDVEMYIDAGNVRRSGYFIFGEVASRVIRISDRTLSGEGRIEVADMRESDDDLTGWINDTAVEVARYFGRFPVDRLLIVLLDAVGGGIEYGRVVAGGGATMLLRIGSSASVDDLYREWVLVHELLHLGSPFMPDGFWFMEGLATYAEPIIRARAGWRSERSVWNEFQRDMPRGAAAFETEGLAANRSGMYWGGALFMLLADIEYRRASEGALGLEHCIRGALDDLGDATGHASVVQLMNHCDETFQSPVMETLARRYVFSGAPFDIDALWRRLGVIRTGDMVRLDDAAPDASLRDAIVKMSAGGKIDMKPDAPDTMQ